MRTSRKLGLPAIDWGNPLSNGLIFAWDAEYPLWDAVNGALLKGDSAVRYGIGLGAFATIRGSANVTGSITPIDQTQTGIPALLYDKAAPPLTVCCLSQGTSTTPNSANLACRGLGSGNPTWGVGLNRGTFSGAYGHVRTSGGSLALSPSAVEFDVTARPYFNSLVVGPTTTTLYGDTLSTKTGSTPSGNFYYEYNPNNNRCLSVNGNYYGTSTINYVALVYNRTLSRDEHLALCANPYQVFRRQSRFIFPAGSSVLYVVGTGFAHSHHASAFSPRSAKARQNGVAHAIAPAFAPRTATAKATGTAHTINPATTPRKALAARVGWSATINNPGYAPRKALASADGHGWTYAGGYAPRRALAQGVGAAHSLNPGYAPRRALAQQAGMAHSFNPAYAPRSAFYAVTGTGHAHSINPAHTPRSALYALPGSAHAIAPAYAPRRALARGVGSAHSHHAPATAPRKALWAASGVASCISIAYGVAAGNNTYRLVAINGMLLADLSAIDGFALSGISAINGITLR